MTALAAFAAVTGSVGAINTVSGWIAKLDKFIEKYGDAGERIQDIYLQVESYKTELDQWQDKWKISSSSTSSWEIELWGQPKMVAIRLKTTKIQSMCIEFREEFDDLFQGDLPTYLDSAISSGEPISRDLAVAAHRAGARRKHPSTLKILGFVRKLDPRATKWLDDMQKLLSELSEASDTAFFDKHEEKVTRILTEAQLEKVRASRLMQMAMNIRSTAQGLYQSCLDAQLAVEAAAEVVKFTRLKVDLMGRMSGVELESVPSQRKISLTYHLYLQWDGTPHELCIEGPVDQTGIQLGAGVLEAYEASQIHEEKTIIINNTPFLSRSPRDEERLSAPIEGVIPPAVGESITLAQFLTGLASLDDKACWRSFPLLERYSLAFKIVESAILLAGTCWLSSMKSDSLRRFQIGESNHFKYTIDTTVPAQVTWKTLIRLSTHIFCVGVVIVEIGYGKRVADIEYDSEATLQFLFDNSEELVPIGPTLKGLETRIDEEYASMAAYCLEDVPRQCNKSRTLSGNAFDMAYKGILEGYFLKVYLRIRERANFLAFMAETVALAKGA